ncbi:MAG: hypothetical protein ACRECW_00655 [Phyllobacterium sp.]
MMPELAEAGRSQTGKSGLRGAMLSLVSRILGCLGRFWVRNGAVLGALTLWAFIVAILAFGWLRPIHTWDMVAYLASAWDGRYGSPAELHTRVWNAIRQGVDPAHFSTLAMGDAYRERQFTDPAAFRSMLGMYEVKWLYVQILGLIEPIFGAVRAGFVINIGAAIGFATVLTWWLRAIGNLYLAPLVVGLLMVAGFPELALAETPDLLTLVLVLSGFLLLEREKRLTGSTFLLLAVLVRPDSAAVCGVLMAMAWLWRDSRSLLLAAVFALSVGAYVFVSKQGHHPGWWPHLWFSTYQMQDTMEGFAPAFSIKVYAVAFVWNLVRSASENSWLGLYMLALGGWAVAHTAGLRLNSRDVVLVAATFIALAAKYVLFPLHDGRTYLPLLLPGILILVNGLWRQGVPRGAHQN